MNTCKIDECQKTVFAKKLCAMHYKRVRRYGDVHEVRTPKGATHWKTGKGNGWLDPKGYRQISVNNKAVFEHRHVMESILGRSLLPNENVHHINGVRDDNRPENLELWVKSQPPGQRVHDVAEHCIAMLKIYRPEALAPELRDV